MVDFGAIRKAILIFTVVFVFFLPNNKLKGDVILGNKHGINLCSQYGYDPHPLENGLMWGFSEGFFSGFAISPYIIFQTELLITVKGRENSNDKMRERISLCYLELPLLFKFNCSKKRITSYLYSGLQFSYSLSGSIYTVDSAGKSLLSLSKSNLKPFDAGVIIGGEVGIMIGVYRIFLDLRHILGLIPTLSQPGGKPRNRVFSLLLGYEFTI